jgi:cell filamentation protein
VKKGSLVKTLHRYRRLNVGKGGFMFAAATRIPALMDEFEAGPLQEHTPCRFRTEREVARAIAVVHVELVLIHPFREGNGRLARLLATLMALQADLPPLDFGGIRGPKRHDYFAAVRSGLDRDYEPMERVFSAVIRRTRRRLGGE